MRITRFTALICSVCALPLLASVRITEFMADNETTVATASGAYEDWIELHNDGNAPVDLTGWRIGTSKKHGVGKGWTFPDGTVIGANDYLLVWCDKLDCVTNGELHANFKISKAGNDDWLWLVDPSDTLQSDYGTFPVQFEDVSYGISRESRELVGASSPATFRVGTSAEAHSATGSIGFASSENAAFTCVHYKMKSPVSNLDLAEKYLSAPSFWSNVVTGRYATVCFADSSPQNTFSPVSPFPAHSSVTEGADNFVLTASGMVTLPTPGVWTFCVCSDDGFRLTVSGHGYSYSTEYTGARSYGKTLLQCNVPEAGAYAVELVYFESTSESACELSVAEGVFDEFDPECFTLVGANECPVKHAGALSRAIGTDVGNVMRGVSSSVTAEWSFNMETAPSDGDVVSLLICCADAFTASLNGIPFGAFNLNEDGTGAAAKRTEGNALTPIVLDVPLTAIVAGSNSLVVTAFNDTARDGDFLVAPVLSYVGKQKEPRYFAAPTPGTENIGTGRTGMKPNVQCDQPRGYRAAPFDVTLSCADDPAATIYYTTDGSVPTAENGILYDGTPIHITSTTTLRAAVPDPEAILPNVSTWTWLFAADIVEQSSTPPAGWPTRPVNGQVFRYGMASGIVNGYYRNRLFEGLTNAPSVATISIVTDLGNLVNAHTGIYVNAQNDGRSWERMVSVEQIDPVHGAENEFQIDAGLRIRGAASRSSSNPKHSFRLFFRNEYRDGALAFRLFGAEGTDKFKKVDLRTSQNYSWAHENSDVNTMMRDVFNRDTQRDMGQPHTRSRYYHLYLNGVYWGLYQTEERGESHWAESYTGSDAENWDTIKTSRDGNSSYVTAATDGTFDAFWELWDITVNQGYSGSFADNYWRVQGMNPDGTPNPDYPNYVNVTNLIDYMLIAQFVVDPDGPASVFIGAPNNMYALRDRTGASGGFIWLRHDSEHSLGAQGLNSSYGYRANVFDWGTGRDNSVYRQKKNFNPAILNDRLMQHPVYLKLFADRVQRHLFGNGALSIASAQERVRSRMAEIDDAIVAESARWGQGYTRSTWLSACNDVLAFIEKRHPVLIQQYRNKGWLPAVDAPLASTNNAAVAIGSTVTLGSATGFWYSTDGTDPENDTTNAIWVPSSDIDRCELAPTNGTWRVFDGGYDPSIEAGDWKTPTFDDSSWRPGRGVFGFAPPGTTVPITSSTHRFVQQGGTNTSAEVITTYFRRQVVLPDPVAFSTRLEGWVCFDDGFIFYLNGVEVVRQYMNRRSGNYAERASASVREDNGQTNYQALAISIPQGILHAGTNTLAVEVHQCVGANNDLLFDLGVSAVVEYPAAVTLTVDDETSLRARAWNGTAWSPLQEVALRLLQDYSALRVTEMMYAAPDENCNYIELKNFGDETINLNGIAFTAGVGLTFGRQLVAPGERIVLVKDVAAFTACYHPADSLVIIPFSSGNTAKKGETIAYSAPDGQEILSYTYTKDWYPDTVETGHSLVAVDPLLPNGDPGWSDGSNWKQSRAGNGTPGSPEPPFMTGIAVKDGLITISAEDLGASWTLLVADRPGDGWVECPASSISLVGSVIYIDTSHRDFPFADVRNLFFKVVSLAK